MPNYTSHCPEETDCVAAETIHLWANVISFSIFQIEDFQAAIIVDNVYCF